jgi:uncharacterized membrane protein YbhN (UPF0104 family)
VGGIIALALAITVVVIGGPDRIWRLLTTVAWTPWSGALAAFVGAMGLRGVRLHLLLEPGELRLRDSVRVATAAQAVALFAPARIGELALPWLLTRAGTRDVSAAIGTLLATRGLDLSALGVWAAVALLVVGAGAGPAMVVGVGLLVMLPLALPSVARSVEWTALRALAPRGVRGRRWTRRARHVSREFDRLSADRIRLLAAYAAALGWWGLIWLMTFLLLRSMGLEWPWWTVVTGSTAASVASWLPLAAVGAVGPLEAGWTAAFHALGVPLETAAASGVACHLWSLLFTAVAGVAAWLALGAQAPPPVDGADTSRSTAAR